MNGYTLDVFVLLVYPIYMDYLHEQHPVHLIVYHSIWCPKRRRRILRGEIAQRLERLVNEIANEHTWQVLPLRIQPDHVHLFIRSNPCTEPSDSARLIKGRSSHALREEVPSLMKMPSLWTRSTCYSTAGKVRSETMQKYSERQSKHYC
jgi:putative transposase